MAFQDIKQKPYYTKQGKNFNLQYDPTNGNVQLVETGILALGTTPLFYNGNFRTDFLDNLGVTTQKKIHYINRYKVQLIPHIKMREEMQQD